jgi:hypothetical protein
MVRSIRMMLCMALVGTSLLTGCVSSPCPCDNVSFVPDVPRELSMVTHPTYTIAAPDILLIDAIRVVPMSRCRVSSPSNLMVV